LLECVRQLQLTSEVMKRRENSIYEKEYEEYYY
jgi:hypothetical protein